MKTRYGRPVYENNPFLDGIENKIIVQTKEFVSNINLTGSNDETIVGTSTSINTLKSLDHLQVTDDWIECMLEFTSNGNVAAWVTVLFMYEINHKAIHRDYLFLPYEQIIEISKLFNKPIPSRSSFSRGLNKMYEKNMIANHYYGNGWYWFNPTMMFNGKIGKIIKG